MPASNFSVDSFSLLLSAALETPIENADSAKAEKRSSTMFFADKFTLIKASEIERKNRQLIVNKKGL